MRSFFLAVGMGVICAAAYAGCGLTVEGELANTGAGPAGSTGAGGGMPDAGIPCMVVDDCPLNTDCTTWACTGGLCDVTVSENGTPIPTGAVQGDCKKNVCQDGKPAVLPDDTDLTEDNDPCTMESCNGGTKQKGPAPDGTACGEMGQLGCSNGLCEGCNKNPDNCSPPTDCQAVTCPVNTCMYETLVGKVVSDAAQDDCKQDVCDANGNVATVGDDTEVPPQVGDKCKAEICLPDGMTGQMNDAEGEKCANPMGVCYNDSICITGACAEQPKPMMKLGDDGISGNCLAKYCDGNGLEVTLPDDLDVPSDPDKNDCKLPQCMGGVLSDKNAANGANCSAMGGDKCCGGACCAETGPGYCDKNDMCCASGTACMGTCCPNAGDKCLNATCCSGNVCGSMCCPTDHQCTVNGGCCPMNQRCMDGITCCPSGQTCNASNQCS